MADTLLPEHEETFWAGVAEAKRFELIRALSLPRETADTLDPSVRAKFDELWLAAQGAGRE